MAAMADGVLADMAADTLTELCIHGGLPTQPFPASSQASPGVGTNYAAEYGFVFGVAGLAAAHPASSRRRRELALVSPPWQKTILVQASRRYRSYRSVLC
jgi:hypothetical protein